MAAAPPPALRALRLRLTLWYCCTLGAIIALLGGGLFLAITHRYNRELERSLHDATDQLERAAQTRELESAARGTVVDAVEELRIQDRALYLLDSTSRPITPRNVPDWVGSAISPLTPERPITVDIHRHHDHTFVVHAEFFRLTSGRLMIAAAAADKIELEDRYSALITAFSVAALLALLLVTGGGYLLVRQATLPIERNIMRMRRFMGDAAHELRTPITVLQAQAEVALDGEHTVTEYAEALRNIGAESRRLGRIVNDLLILARADSGDRPVALHRLFVDDIVADAVGAMGAMAHARGVSLAVAAFEEAAVHGDAELLRQLVMILLDNAIKYTARGGSVEVSVRCVGNRAEIQVTDTGIGIAETHLPHVFERFFRVDAARGREGADAASGASGTGLGLSIARWIADAHGATLSLRSVVGSGTTMVVLFPPAAVSSS